MVFLMEKVKELTESQIITKQIIRLDKVLQKTAILVIQNFIETSDKDHRFCDSFDLKEEWIDELEDAFRNSPFFNREGFDVAAAFDDTMYPLAEINHEDIMRILYPVLFYTLILKNYDNQESANKRAKRGSKTWKKVSDILTVPMVGEQDDGNDKTDADKREKLEELIKQAEQHELKLRAQLIKEEIRYIRFNLRELQDLLFHAENAMYLLNSKKVSWIEAMAKRGLLVRTVLESQQDHSKPIDSVLRLYVLNAIDEVVFRSEQMSNRGRSSVFPKTYFLSSFRMNIPIPIEYLNDSDYLKKRKFDIPEGALEEKLDISNDFSYLYAQLSKTTFKQADIEYMLDYFFDPEQLKWYTDCTQSVSQYISTVTRAIQKFVDSVNADEPAYENINERYLDSEHLFTPLRMRMFDN